MSQGDGGLCAACDKAITRKHYSILCFLCDKWSHSKCVDLSVSQLKFYESELKKPEGDRWSCPSCLRETVRKSQTARKSLGGAQNKSGIPAPSASVTLEDIMHKLNCMELANKDLLDMYNRQLEVNNLLRSEMDNLNSRLATAETELRNLNHNPPVVANEELFQEYRDREQRRSNIIIFGQPEPTSDDIHDADSVNSILCSLCSNFDVSNIIEVLRIGNIQNQNSNNAVIRPRPLKVRFKNTTSPVEVFKQCNKLKNNAQLRHLTITSDKTAKQMQLYKSVKEQFAQRKNSGETNIKIGHVKGVPTIVPVTGNGVQAEN